jgi:hypothetical protein
MSRFPRGSFAVEIKTVISFSHRIASRRRYNDRRPRQRPAWDHKFIVDDFLEIEPERPDNVELRTMYRAVTIADCSLRERGHSGPRC